MSASRLVTIVLVAGLLVVALLASVLPSTVEGVEGSVYSFEQDGRAAALGLLGELGYDARPWTRAPGELVGRSHLLVLPTVPERPLGYDSPEADGPQRTGSRRLRDPLHYRRFVEDGGTLLTVFGPEMRDFLVDDLGLDALAELDLRERVDSEGFSIPAELSLEGGESLSLAPGALNRVFRPLPVVAPLETRVATASGRGVVLEMRLGQGSLLLLADDRFLWNERIQKQDAALLFVRLVESRAPGTRVLFDEYALGGWTPESPLELALAPGAIGFTLHLAAFVLLLVWAGAWVGPFPRDPEPLEQLSPLARARSLAGLLASTRRFGLGAALLRRGVLRRLVRGHGAREVDGELAPERVAALLGPLAPRLADVGGLERASELFSGALPTDRAGLSRLASDLEALESHLFEGTAPRAGRPNRRALARAVRRAGTKA